MEELFETLLSKNVSVAVIGDTLIDEYFSVDVKRLSPEFPVPILRSNNMAPYKTVCGGAANVTNQFKYFNVKASLVSLLNEKAIQICDEEDIDSWSSIQSKDCFVPVKKRFYHEDHPLIRWDIEDDSYGITNIQEYLDQIVVPKADVEIYSDYNKGFFTRKFEMNKKQKSLVDPKVDIEQWKGCYLFKPNYEEAVKITGYKDVKKQIDFLLKYIKCKNIVITKSGDGVFGYCSKQGFIEVIPEKKMLKPESVIGAGDCFISFLAMGIACGFELKKCLELAFEAGTLYVSNKYNQPLCMADFFRKNKIINNYKYLDNRNFNLVFTNGCFDVLHKGHIHSLREAKKHGDRLCVGLNSDASIRRNKGEKRPIMPLESRIEVLKSLEFVDYILVFDDDTPENVLKIIKPDVYVKGTDYKNKELHGSQYAHRVVLVDLLDGYSTTKFCG